MDTFTITLLGACGTTLVGAIGIVWKDNGSLRDKLFDSFKDIMQSTNSFSNVINSLVGALASLKEAVEKLVDQSNDLEERIKNLENKFGSGRRK